MGYGAGEKINKVEVCYVEQREQERQRWREEENGGGWRDTESLVKVKPDSLRVVMEAG